MYCLSSPVTGTPPIKTGLKIMLRVHENRLVWADNLRVVAIIAVIFLHASANIVQEFGKVSSSVWWTGNIFNSMVRFSVPLFVMLTGALLLPKKYELFDFLKSRSTRVLIPFIFWGAIYIGVALYEGLSKGNQIDFWGAIKFIGGSFLTGYPAFHLWYVDMIVGIYLFLPIIGKWVRNCNEKEILYFLVIWLVTLIIEPVKSRFQFKIDLRYFTGFVGYAVLGYYLSKKSLGGIRVYSVAILFYIIGYTITLIGTYVLSVREGTLVQTFYDYLTPNVVLMSVGVFLLVKDKNILKSPLLVKMRDWISTYSYGIYLVHILILRFLDWIGINSGFITPVIGIPVTALFCLAGSGIVIYLLNKVPFGKYVAG
jgi:surface polysaccharide O-acyltransferase-like enzyme